ncbi:hypothetical protein LIA77_05592 [Sarocladium implicatum]|nr:hypothetical protein LIA77_05592 [Sarocladium implicatum]
MSADGHGLEHHVLPQTWRSLWARDRGAEKQYVLGTQSMKNKDIGTRTGAWGVGPGKMKSVNSPTSTGSFDWEGSCATGAAKCARPIQCPPLIITAGPGRLQCSLLELECEGSLESEVPCCLLGKH